MMVKCSTKKYFDVEHDLMKKEVKKVVEENLIEIKDIHFGQLIHDTVKIEKGSKLKSFEFQFAKDSIEKILCCTWHVCTVVIILTMA